MRESDQIAERMKEFGLSKYGSLKEFADALDISPEHLSQYVNGKSKPGNKTQQRLRDLGCDIEWLMTGKRANVVAEQSHAYAMMGFAPFLGRVVADPSGKEYFDDTEIPVGAGVPFFKGNYFCLEVENDSMINAEPISIYPGDICVFEAKRQPKNGDIVAVHLKDGRRLVKIMKHRGVDDIELISANKFRNYPSVKVKKSHIASFGILVTKVQVVEEAKKRFGLKK